MRDCGLSLRDCGLSLSDCGLSLRDCGLSLRDCGLSLRDCGPSLRDCGPSFGHCGPSLRDCGPSFGHCGRSDQHLPLSPALSPLRMEREAYFSRDFFFDGLLCGANNPFSPASTLNGGTSCLFSRASEKDS